jgi:DNA repair protein RecN (Recombination protein N)
MPQDVKYNMLKRLYIKNFAIVDNLDLIFDEGFQVITGETGAGKSILVGALGLLCGDRAQTEFIRSGNEKAIIEAEFTIHPRYAGQVDSILSGSLIETIKDLVIIRREIHLNGTSRAFINDTPVNINSLKNISELLIDLHGQHQHQRLLHPENHIIYLDAYGKIQPIFDKYSQTYQSYCDQKNKLDFLYAQKKSNFEKHDLYSYQLNELEKANLKEGELEDLISERKIQENIENIYEVTQTVSNLLYLAQDSILEKITTAKEKLNKILSLDKKFKEWLDDLDSTQVTVEEIGRLCEQYYAHLEFDPKRIEEIRNREAEIVWLLKKYQMKSVSEIIRYQQNLKDQISSIKNLDDQIIELEEEVQSEKDRLQKLALDLSETRKEIAKKFEEFLHNVLHSVGMKNAKFATRIEWDEKSDGIVNYNNKTYALNKYGLDRITFQISLNPGEKLKPLHKIASGGEISRIMLSIKSLLADVDEVPTLVFDEIDIGISGKIAQIVGKKMYEVSKNHQIIVITHLPQIAAQGQSHYAVYKIEENGRTKVTVKKLSRQERITDIAKLLAGENISNKTIANAEELLNMAR